MRQLLALALLASSLSIAPAALADPAQASTPLPAPSSAPSAQQLDIVVDADGFDAPSALLAGTVTLRVRSTDPHGAWLGLVRLRPGVTLTRYLGNLERAMGDDPVDGGTAVARDVDMLGGVAVADVPAAATLAVSPGRYYLIDFKDVGLPDLARRVRPVTVLPGHAGLPPTATTRITLTDGRFTAPEVFRGPVHVANLSRQYNEAMLMPVRPGTSLADLDKFFTEVDAGRYPNDAPFTGGPTGVVPPSPGRSVVLDAPLPAGRYALVTWVRDLRTGRMFAAEGMRTLITVEG
ncbi:hypothetical protein [Micromonospora eburnea]|uniref:Uncharacterized protein n=1 Tax=Micromonospora eburnea TaxID=227316 RepID=A0A1C6V136_9ACTN|nr:hypothetical protein [Micromonospora eburnea]SCL60018.1 hypothetical protein GA0070604_4195 [Micromonospora eburnea]